MNRCKAPKIPPILVNHSFVTDCKMKCNIFAKYFSEQCKLIVNSSVLPPFSYLTNARFNVVNISGELLSLLQAINPTKPSGSDEISGRMLLLYDESLVQPLKLLFENIVSTRIYPYIWKHHIHWYISIYLETSYPLVYIHIFGNIISTGIYPYIWKHHIHWYISIYLETSYPLVYIHIFGNIISTGIYPYIWKHHIHWYISIYLETSYPLVYIHIFGK